MCRSFFRNVFTSLLLVCSAALAAEPQRQPTFVDPANGNPTADDRLWHLDRIDQELPGTVESPQLDGHYTYCSTGQGVVVYVIDTGIERSHQEFDGVTVENGENFSGDPSWMPPWNPCGRPATAAEPSQDYPKLYNIDFPSDIDLYADEVVEGGHGTSVASLIAGRFSGAAKGVTLVPLKALPCQQHKPRAWLRNHDYLVNDFVRTGQNTFIARRGGHSGGAPPLWDNQVGHFTDEGTGRPQWEAIAFPDFDQLASMTNALRWILRACPSEQPCNPHHDTPGIVTFSGGDLTPPSPANPTRWDAFLDALSDVIEAGLPVIASANNAGTDACSTAPPVLSRGNASDPLHADRIGKVITVGGAMIVNNPDPPGRGDGGTGLLEPYDSRRAPEDARWIAGPGDSVRLIASNSGRCVDLWAPAKNITSALASARTAYRDRRGHPDDLLPPLASGTSFSAPLATAVAARFLQAYGVTSLAAADKTALVDDVYNALMNTAVPDILDPCTLNASNPPPSPCHPNTELRNNFYLQTSDLMFLKQPSSLSPAPGQQVTLETKVVTTLDDVTYAWYRGLPHDTSRPLRDGNDQPITTPVAAFTPDSAGHYWARVSGTCDVIGSVTRDSRPAAVRRACPGTESMRIIVPAKVGRMVQTTLAVSLDGDDTPEPPDTAAVWTWYRGRLGDTSQPVAGYSSSTANVSAAEPTYFWAKRTAGGCTTELAEILLPVCTGIFIGSLPSEITVIGGSSVVLTAPVTGPKFLEYAWFNRRVDNVLERLPCSTKDCRITFGMRSVFVDVSSPFCNPMRSSATTVKSVTFGPSAEFVAGDGSFVAEGGSAPVVVQLTTHDGQPSTQELAGSYETSGISPPGNATLGLDYEMTRGSFTFPAGSQPGVTRHTISIPIIPDELKEGDETFEVRLRSTTEKRHNVTIIDDDDSGGCTGKKIVTRAGFCVLLRKPTFIGPSGGRLTIVPDFRDQLGAPIDQSGMQFMWTVGSNVIPTASVEVTLGSVESVTLKVTKTDYCEDIFSVVLKTEGSCTGCIVQRGKCRSVRAGGQTAKSVTIQEGQSVDLSVDETEPADSYEWHRESQVTADEAFSASPSVTVTPLIDTTYWARLIRQGVPEETDRIYVAVEPAIDPGTPLVISPRIQVVTAHSVARITATFTPSDADRASEPGAVPRFEWRRGATHDLSAPILDEDDQLDLVDLPDSTTFWVRVRFGSKIYDSSFANVAVTCTPSIAGTIAVSPVGGRVARNEPPLLDVAAYGKLLTYAWYRGTSALDPNKTLAGVGPAIRPYVSAPTTWFSVLLDDSCGQTATVPAVPIYLCIPAITQQPPQKRVIRSGETAPLTIAASPAYDGQSLGYQWFRASDVNMSQPLPESSSTTFNATEAGDYFAAVVTTCVNSGDQKTRSEVATVEVCSNPTITSHTAAGSITAAGQSAPLVVAASGKELSYQWYRGATGDTNNPLAGETEYQIAVSPATTTSYWCRVTSQGLCTSDTPTIPVNVCRTPQVTDQPDSQRIFRDGTATLTVAATEVLGNDITYQWYHDMGNGMELIAGATATTYTTPALTADRRYQVKLSAGECTNWSEVATVSICTYGAVIGGPSDRSIAVGQSTLLQVMVSPVYDKFVTWYEGESGVTTNPIGGGSLNAVINVTPSVTTKYWAKVEHEGCVSRTTTTTVRVCIPTIADLPANIVVTSPSTTRVTAQATPAQASQGLTYQWYTGSHAAGWTVITGATSSFYDISTAGQYRVGVSTTCGDNQPITAYSTVVTAYMCYRPSISGVTNAEIKSGQNGVVSVTATGANLTYQWYRGVSPNTATPIAGATTATLVDNPTTTSSYWCRVTSNGSCSSDSATATITVCTPASITPLSPPAPIRPNQTATLTVTSSGATSHQWYRAADNTPITGATGTSYTTPALTQDTSYWVRAYSGVCETNSTPVQVTVCHLGVNVTATKTQTAVGESSILTASPSNARSTGMYYTWYVGLTGNTSQIYTQGPTQSSIQVSPSSTTHYWVRVSDGTCTIDSNSTKIDVCRPGITTHPASSTVNGSGSASLTVAANVSPVTYQWYAGASGVTTNPVPGGTTAAITVTPGTSTYYWARVTGCDSTNSNAALVCVPPSITATQGNSIAPGSNARISVTASGTWLTYQWYIGAAGTTTNPIAGATQSYVDVTPTTTTNYWCKVTSANMCSTNSTTITVSVCANPSISAQPANKAGRYGEASTLSVTAAGSITGYQWYRGAKGDFSSPVSGQTTATLNTGALYADTQFWANVLNGLCATKSEAATVYACSLDVSVNSPIIYRTQSVVLTASVSNARPGGAMYYRWYYGTSGNTGQLITAGPTQSSIQVSPNDTTTYWVEVSDGTCTRNSATATVYVCIPRIMTHPMGGVIVPGGYRDLTVATDLAGSTVQWFTGSSPAPGTSNQFTYRAQPASTTSYWARVTSPCGLSNNSDAATVTVCSSPTVSLPQTMYYQQYGYGTELIAYGSGTNLTYQWYRGPFPDFSNPIPGATSDRVSVYPTATTQYWVRVTSDGVCAANSGTITVDVCTSPSITAQPQNVTAPSGTTTRLTVTASAPSGPMTYQWYAGASGNVSNPLSGQTNSYLDVTANGSSSYWVRITRGACAANSATATVTGCTGPQFYYGSAYNYNGCWTLSVSPYGYGAGELSYDWFEGTSGDTSKPLGAGSYYRTVCPSALTKYWVRVWNPEHTCSTNSGTATVYPVE